MVKNPYAYRLAPWRKQIRMILNVVLTAIIVASIAMIYLSISAKMTDVKLQIQVLQEQRNKLNWQISDLTTDQGIETSYKTMEQRAVEAGFVDIDFDNEDIYSYLVIDGYNGTGTHTVARETTGKAVSGSLIKPEYVESLQQWLSDRIAIGIKSNESQY